SEKVQKSREKLKKREESIDKAMKRSAEPRKTYREPIKNLKVGETVKLIDVDQTATVLKLPDNKGMVRVQAGIMKTDVHISNLERVKDNSTKELTEKYVRSTNAYQSKTKNVSTEIDVRGQLPEEALMNVEKFIDDCYLAGISPVTVIHGKGTGVLRKAVGDMLKRSKYVKSSRPGKFGEGEMGVTIVELK
ncbi:MAG: Smr/MutS family protein, partial [Clostridia bacterium]|nr:Smr/MutS family protein [Clostridia bacterium]